MIDSKGRLFGVINLVDLAIVLLMTFGAAVGLAAFRVFRIPAPVVERVEPVDVPASPAPRVRLIGHNFRHYLQAFVPRSDEPFAVTLAAPAAFEAPIISVTEDVIELQLPHVRPGSYDLYLFDNAKLLVHLPAALKVVPTAVPRATIRATVRLMLPTGAADQLHVGDRDGGLSPTADTADDAQIEKLDVRPDRVEMVEMRLARQPSDDHYLWAGNHSVQVIVDAVLRVPVVERVPGRWDYKDRPVRAGEDFVIETPAAKFRGVVVSRGEPETAR